MFLRSHVLGGELWAQHALAMKHGYIFGLPMDFQLGKLTGNTFVPSNIGFPAQFPMGRALNWSTDVATEIALE